MPGPGAGAWWGAAPVPQDQGSAQLLERQVVVGQAGQAGKPGCVPAGPGLHQHKGDYVVPGMGLGEGGQSEEGAGTPCPHSPVCSQCLVVGAGPCGLRAAVELALLGARVVLVEKRTKFSRHNVLHLWPFTIHDLRALGAKKFYGRFCTGTLDHISE